MPSGSEGTGRMFCRTAGMGVREWTAVRGPTGGGGRQYISVKYCIKIFRGTALNESLPVLSPVPVPAFWALALKSHYAQDMSIGER